MAAQSVHTVTCNYTWLFG